MALQPKERKISIKLVQHLIRICSRESYVGVGPPVPRYPVLASSHFDTSLIPYSGTSSTPERNFLVPGSNVLHEHHSKLGNQAGTPKLRSPNNSYSFGSPKFMEIKSTMRESTNTGYRCQFLLSNAYANDLKNSSIRRGISRSRI